jgi:hypothetical protein
MVRIGSVALAFALTACGDNIAPPDRSRCSTPAELGATGSLPVVDSFEHNQPGSRGAHQVYVMTAKLENSEPSDILRLELWDDFGAFAGGDAEPGVFYIDGPETDLGTCGVCLTVRVDDDPLFGTNELYIAVSGTVVVDELGDRYSGTISDILFAEIDPETEDVMPGGCTTELRSASFSAPLSVIGGGGG